jgi:adenylate kinase family enzyme
MAVNSPEQAPTEREALLLAGSPGSGKSSIAKRFIEFNLVDGARHLSIGDLKRSITSGERPSVYADTLRDKLPPNPRTGTAPTSSMIGIMEEFISEDPHGLVIIDGFPRYADRVEPFKASMQKLGTQVLALCIVKTSDNVVRERLRNRPHRKNQALDGVDFIEQRLVDHYENIVPTLEALSRSYPTYYINGSQSLDRNAYSLFEVYRAHHSEA